jgi:hypothetical protein
VTRVTTERVTRGRVTSVDDVAGDRRMAGLTQQSTGSTMADVA